MTYILVDTADNNHIRFDIQVNTINEALAKLGQEEKRFSDSKDILKNLSNVGNVQPLSGGISFYQFIDNIEPEADPVISEVIDHGYKVLQESVERVWEVVEKSFDDMKQSILEAIEKHYDSERTQLSLDIEGKLVSASLFFSQYVEAKVVFSSGDISYNLDTDDGSNISLDETSMDLLYNQLKDAIETNYNTKNNKKSVIFDVTADDKEGLKTAWGNIKAGF